MNRKFILASLSVCASLALAGSVDAKKKKEKEPDIFDECPVKETIRVSSENSLDGLRSLANCDDVEVAEADPDEIKIRTPIRYAPRNHEIDASSGNDLHDADLETTTAASGGKALKGVKVKSAGMSKKSKQPLVMSASVTATGTQFLRIVPTKDEMDYVPASLPEPSAAPAVNYAVPQTSIPSGTPTSGDGILVMKPQSYTTVHDTLIAEVARRHRIDPLLLHAVIKQESGYKQTARSWVGARGLMQIMPGTGAMLGVRTEHLNDPATNVDAGARLLRKLAIKYNGNFDLVLAAYNAGEGAVSKYGYRIPPYRETQDYVRKVMVHYNKLLIENVGQVAAK